MGTGKGSQRSGMGWSESPGRKRSRVRRGRAEEKRWAAKSSAVTVTQAELCEVEDCDGSCGKWHGWS
jgi:hypothetical protein